MTPHRIGIIGYGGFGQFLHRAWATMDRVQVAAVADMDPGRDPGPPVRFYRQWEELTDDPGIDLVVIATPPFTHADMSCEAMTRGKHVLIEKPMATSLEGARRIIVVATRDKINRVTCLRVDTNDAEVDKRLKGYMKVVTHYNEEIILKVA